MSELLRISVLDRTDTQDFEQLMVLLKKFTIDTYVRNKPEYAYLRGRKEDEVVNSAIQEFEKQTPPSILTQEDIEQLKKDIDSQISSAKELIDKKINGNTETRYYVMKDDDIMVSFHQVQLVKGKDNGRIEGWRNLAYAEQNYRGSGQVIDSRGAIQEGRYSEIIYDDIGYWFEDNGVNYERTCTGVNMLGNILMYVRYLGFLPFSKNDKNVFLEKFKEHKVDIATLSKVYKLYCQHRQRTEHKNKDEIIEEIQSTSEFGELTEEQKQGLVRCFLKEGEKEFEIPDDKLQMLNGFIHENLKNRRNSTDYNLLHTISGMMTRGLNVKDRNISEITTPSTEYQTKEIALQFFKDLDQELYEKVKNIVEGNSEIDFNMYKFDKTEDFSRTKSDGMPVHTKTPCVISKDGKSAVYVPCKGTVEDIYLLVHELSHTFDLIQNDNPTRNMLGEVTPYCFEAMLSQYLVENGVATKEEVTNREKGNIISHYDDGVETFAKLELMGIKEQQGEIKQKDIIVMQKRYGITNRKLNYVLGRLAQSEPNVDYKARYMIAQLIYPHYMEQYEKNLHTALQALEKYFEMIKTNNFEGSLETLGISPSIDSIQRLIETANRRIENLQHTRMFSKEEIGKSTISTPTIDKDNAQDRLQRDKQEIKKKKKNLSELE